MEEEDVDRHINQRLTQHKEDMLREIGNLFQISNASNHSELTKISKLLSAEVPKFKRKSNEEQYKVNSKVMAKLEEVQTAQDPNQSKAFTKEAFDMLAHRQKLILLADTSELGWKVVHEYESNPLADDSEDERRILKAETRAARKAKAERSKRGRSRFTPYGRGSFRADTTVRAQAATRPSAAPSQRPGLCFACGKAGHWKNECPGTGSNNKMSINFDNFESECDVAMPDCGKACEVRGTELKRSSKALADEASPVGRLKSCYSRWEEITSDAYVLDVINNGYKLPLKTTPSSICLRNNSSAMSNQEFVTAEIERLVAKGIVTEVQSAPTVVSPLTVSRVSLGYF